MWTGQFMGKEMLDKSIRLCSESFVVLEDYFRLPLSSDPPILSLPPTFSCHAIKRPTLLGIFIRSLVQSFSLYIFLSYFSEKRSFKKSKDTLIYVIEPRKRTYFEVRNVWFVNTYPFDMMVYLYFISSYIFICIYIPHTRPFHKERKIWW